MPKANSINTFKSLSRKLVSDSNLHYGLRVLIAMSIAFIPALTQYTLPFFEQSNLQISVSLCLGVMAGAIVETDDNDKNRRKFILSSVLCFFIAASCVGLLMPYPVIFALGLLISSFLFMMLAIFGNHYNRIGFGAILIAIYGMLGYEAGISWYQQPILLSLGGLWYGLFAILWNMRTPYRSLREQLAQLFFSLSRYQHQKSGLFNEQQYGNKEGLYAVRQQLAIQNIAIVGRFQQSKRIIQSRFRSCKSQPELEQLNYYFFIAEQIHERMSASQYLYSQLESIFGESQILEGYHQLLLQLSNDCYDLGIAISVNKDYQHSRQLKWTIKALADQLYLLKQQLKLTDDSHEAMQALQAIYENINGINQLLLDIEEQQKNKTETLSIAVEEVFNSPEPAYKQFLSALKISNPVCKHALRISIALTVAYILQQTLHLSHGFWILLTVLFVCQPSFSETRKRLILRSLGTFGGVLLGYPLMLMVDGVFTQVAVIILLAFLFFSYLRTNYGLAVVFITLFVMFIFDLLNPTGIEIVLYRLLETLIGCLISVLAISFIFPDWQFKRFPALVNQLLSLSNRYFQQVSDQYQYGRSETLNYRITRFKTFESDAMLATAWQSMLFEPNSKQKLGRETYALVNRCDALVSYIAALASHRHKMDDFENNVAIQSLITATSKQISLAINPSEIDSGETIITIEEFENFKQSFTGENLLIVEQLRLVAFAAIDIQVLFQQVKYQAQLN